MYRSFKALTGPWKTVGGFGSGEEGGGELGGAESMCSGAV